MKPRAKRRRALQRGAIITELLVVVPMLIIMCGIGFWFYQVHKGHLKVYREVREPVWATATFGCGEAGDTGRSMPGTQAGVSISGQGPPIVPVDWSQVYRNVPGGPNNEVITRGMGEANSKATQTVAGYAVLGFSPDSQTFNATATMQCNEAVHNGNPNGAKRIAALVFSP